MQLSTSFQKVDARSFKATIYINGDQATKCGIWLGSSFGSREPLSIKYSYSGLEQGRSSYNESMSVKDGENILGLELLGISHHSWNDNKLLTKQGAAEYYWSLFIKPLQPSS
jgi:hypothetical protein